MREKSENENLNQERRERPNKKRSEKGGRREEGSHTKIVFLILSLSFSLFLSVGNGYLPYPLMGGLETEKRIVKEKEGERNKKKKNSQQSVIGERDGSEKY